MPLVLLKSKITNTLSRSVDLAAKIADFPYATGLCNRSHWPTYLLLSMLRP